VSSGCHNSRVYVDRENSKATVISLKIAELVELIEAVKRVFPTLSNIMIFENILISNSLLQVRCRQERRLLLKSGICRIFENSTVLIFFP